MAQISVKKCDLCEQKDGIHFCYECRHALCDGCRKTHDKFPALSRHNVGSIHQVDLLNFNTNLRCGSHEKDFEIYCESCKSLICSNCVTTTHIDHKFSDIGKLVSLEREDAQKTIANLKMKIRITSDLKEKIRCEHLMTLKLAAERVTGDIRTTFRELTQLIESKKGIKETEVEDFEHLERQQLESYRQNAGTVITKYSRICSELENLLAEKHDITFHVCYKTLTNDIEYPDSINEEPNIRDFPDFDVRSVFKEIFDFLNSKCEQSLCENCVQQGKRVDILVEENKECKEKLKSIQLRNKELAAELKDAKSLYQDELKSKMEAIKKAEDTTNKLQNQDLTDEFERHNQTAENRQLPIRRRRGFTDYMRSIEKTDELPLDAKWFGFKATRKYQNKDAAANVNEAGIDRISHPLPKELEDCVICMDTVHNPRTLLCGHVFCHDCIDEALTYCSICPICGSEIV